MYLTSDALFHLKLGATYTTLQNLFCKLVYVAPSRGLERHSYLDVEMLRCYANREEFDAAQPQIPDAS